MIESANPKELLTHSTLFVASNLDCALDRAARTHDRVIIIVAGAIGKIGKQPQEMRGGIEWRLVGVLGMSPHRVQELAGEDGMKVMLESEVTLYFGVVVLAELHGNVFELEENLLGLGFREVGEGFW